MKDHIKHGYFGFRKPSLCSFVPEPARWHWTAHGFWQSLHSLGAFCWDYILWRALYVLWRDSSPSGTSLWVGIDMGIKISFFKRCLQNIRLYMNISWKKDSLKSKLREITFMRWWPIVPISVPEILPAIPHSFVTSLLDYCKCFRQSCSWRTFRSFSGLDGFGCIGFAWVMSSF